MGSFTISASNKKLPTPLHNKQCSCPGSQPRTMSRKRQSYCICLWMRTLMIINPSQ
ncbi:Uncharacterised protein [Vibrio cholerae]|nr:Uncharacterised protein [Vibrio cholerae]CSI57495.1 Uncharacterised protein [Vibrio cholerae]